MSRLTLRRKGTIRAAAISAAGLVGAIVPMSAFGSGLTINLVAPTQPGSAANNTVYATPYIPGQPEPAVPVTIDVYGTVSGGTLGASDFDGIQYAYYNINAIGASGNPTVLGGSVTAATPNADSGANFNGGVEAGTGETAETGNGVQPGTVTGATASGLAVGSTTAATSIAKPRSANIVWSNASAPAGDITTTATSASFLLEKITYLANSTPSTIIPTNVPQQTQLSVTIPTAALAAADLVGANWWQDSTSASSSPTGFQNGTYSAGTSVNITTALAGDANLDGSVGISDFNALSHNYGQPLSFNGGQPFTWAEGDFNGDGSVGIADFNALSHNYNQGGIATGPLDGDAGPLEAFAIAHNDVAGFEAATGLTIAVPEPTSLGLLAIGGISLLARRRRVSS